MTKRATVREGSDAKSRMLGTVEVGRVVEALEERHVFFKGAPPPPPCVCAGAALPGSLPTTQRTPGVPQTRLR